MGNMAHVHEVCLSEYITALKSYDLLGRVYKEFTHELGSITQLLACL
jgi:hypothetical protein